MTLAPLHYYIIRMHALATLRDTNMAPSIVPSDTLSWIAMIPIEIPQVLIAWNNLVNNRPLAQLGWDCSLFTWSKHRYNQQCILPSEYRNIHITKFGHFNFKIQQINSWFQKLFWVNKTIDIYQVECHAIMMEMQTVHKHKRAINLCRIIWSITLFIAA